MHTVCLYKCRFCADFGEACNNDDALMICRNVRQQHTPGDGLDDDNPACKLKSIMSEWSP